MACVYCHMNEGHLPQCPLHKPSGVDICEICKYPLVDGEEYIENSQGKYVHKDCVDSYIWLAKWLEGEIGEYDSHDN